MSTDNSENAGAIMDFTKKAVHESGVEFSLGQFFSNIGHDWKQLAEWAEVAAAPWTFNEWGHPEGTR